MSSVNATRVEARAIAKRFMYGYQPPVTCGHSFTKWVGLLIRLRICRSCGLVEGSVR